MIMTTKVEGDLIATFSNGHTQKFILHGVLLRPKLVLQTMIKSKNDKGQDELDFGICHIESRREVVIYLSNITEVTANWRIEHMKVPTKPIVSKYTITKSEKED